MFNQEPKRSQKKSHPSSSKKGVDSKRKLFLENLEDRRLLTVGPQLIGIQPNSQSLIPLDSQDTAIYDNSPSELVFNFDQNQVFDPNNLDGIQITRANLDGEFEAASAITDFGQPGEVSVRFTAVKMGLEGNDIKLVFSKRNQGGPGLPEISVEENQVNVVLNIFTGNESTVGQVITALETNVNSYALLRAENLLADEPSSVAVDLTTSLTNDYSPVILSGANDLVVQPGFVGLGDTPNQIVVRYSDTLPDDLYRIDVFGDGKNALRNASGAAFDDTLDDGVDQGFDFSTTFELDLGARIISVVPQPIIRGLDANGASTLSQAKNQILLFFNEDDLHVDSVSKPEFYRLTRTNNTHEFTDDSQYYPVDIEYNSATNGVLLTFQDDLDQLPGEGAFRLRVGSDEPLPGFPREVVEDLDLVEEDENLDVEILFEDPESVEDKNTFDTAQPVLFDQLLGSGVMISGEITEDEDFPIAMPGEMTEPGHRETNNLAHNHLAIDFAAPPFGWLPPLPNFPADTDQNITTYYYCFQNDLGLVPGDQGLQPAYNTITEVQKQRAREIIEQVSSRTGVQFVETEGKGLIIATADLAVVGENSVKGGTLGVSAMITVDGEQRPIVVMDDAEDWKDQFGASWYQVAMHELGHFLGLSHAYDLPAHTSLGQQTVEESEYGPALLENDFPGQHDLVHLNHLHPVESRDFDLYRFEVEEAGIFIAETIAERLRDLNSDNRVLNTALRLMRRTDGLTEVVAMNDDYFSDDSYLELHLEKGEYFLGVSASGNTAYEPLVPDSGFYGTSEGSYKLKMFFKSDIDLQDWETPVADLPILIDADNPLTQLRPDGKHTAFDGDLDGTPGGLYDFWFAAEPAFSAGMGDEPATYFVDKSALSEEEPDGSLERPFVDLPSAFAAVGEGDVLRLLSNPGWGADISAKGDVLAYEIGYSEAGEVLSDGANIEVPKGVVLQVDPNVIMKFRRSMLSVGSTSASEFLDRSGAALQVFGAPSMLDSLGNILSADGVGYADEVNGDFTLQPLKDSGGHIVPALVNFTSYNDESLGADTFPLDTTPSPGDWGGF